MAKGKRANNEGTVYQRRDGRWEAALTFTDTSGSRKRKRTFRNTREEADLALARLKVERDGGILISGKNPRLSDWLIAWLRDSVVSRVSPRTLEWYEIACRVHIIPEMGHVRMRDITPRHVSALDSKLLRENYSVESRRKIMGTLKRALRQAEMWGDIPKNPASLVPPPKEQHVADEDEEIKTFTEAELHRLFDVDDRFRTLYVVAGRTGLRQGELLALRASDLELADPATLAVRRSLATKPGGGYYYTPLKRRRQRRRVILHHEAAEALREQLEARRSSEDDLLWPSMRGTPMNSKNVVNRYYTPVLAEAGLPKLNFHALRHTFASIALYEWRMPVALVSEMLGHANTSITLDIYAHLAPGTHESEMKRINELYRSKKAVNKSE